MYSTLIQNFNRFVLEQLHQECGFDKPPVSANPAPSINQPPSPIQQVFGMKTASTSICGHCGLEDERITYPFVLDLVWPKPVRIDHENFYYHYYYNFYL
jgi:PAB-dependent poly(A)-specific ribonuclease subunit 2